MKILVTGGSGLLGTELKKLDSTLLLPGHDELDITNFDLIIAALKKYQPEVVLHLAAATKPPEHEKDPTLGLRVNIIGTSNIALACLQVGCKLVYTSTDYVYKGDGPHKEAEAVLPPYKFGWSKLGGETAVLMLENSLVLRLSFGPVPFPWKQVYEGQWNSKLYVDEMAPLILKAAQSKATGIMNVGGPRATLESYARRTQSDITTIAKPDWVPRDTSLDLSKMQNELGIKDLQQLLKH